MLRLFILFNSPDPLQQICEMLAGCDSLTHLSLDRNQLGPEAIAELCEELKHNRSLLKLSLADTDAGGTLSLQGGKCDDIFFYFVN